MNYWVYGCYIKTKSQESSSKFWSEFPKSPGQCSDNVKDVYSSQAFIIPRAVTQRLEYVFILKFPLKGQDVPPGTCNSSALGGWSASVSPAWASKWLSKTQPQNLKGLRMYLSTKSLALISSTKIIIQYNISFHTSLENCISFQEVIPKSYQKTWY